MQENTEHIDALLSRLIGHDKQPSHQRKFEDIIKPYAEHWERWIYSEACFLDTNEAIVVEAYRLTGSHASAIEQLSLSRTRVAEIFNTAQRRLINNQHLYRHWIANHIIEEIGLGAQKGTTEHFLTRPMHEHNFSKSLYMILSLEAENLKELLALYTAPEMQQIRNFGAKKMKELKSILQENGCLHLLRNA